VAHDLGRSSWFWEHVFARHPDLARVALRGTGGVPGRLRRLLAANPTRPVLVEHSGLAAELELRPCDVAWLVRAESGCAQAPDATATRAATQAIANALAAIRDGSPASDAALARVALDRGEALWRIGRGAEALDALLAGVPAGERPAPTAIDRDLLARVAPLGRGLPAWRGHVPLGEPSRNLFVAALLLQAAGDEAAAARQLLAARALGLPEATP